MQHVRFAPEVEQPAAASIGIGSTSAMYSVTTAKGVGSRWIESLYASICLIMSNHVHFLSFA